MDTAHKTRRLLVMVAALAGLAAIWLVIDALRQSRIPRSGRPVETSVASSPAPIVTTPLPAQHSTPANARLTIDWEDPDGRTYRSDLALEPDAIHPVAASVVTCNHATGQELIRYRARARREQDGTLIIDATGAAVSGIHSGEWSPDSFTIARDGRVTTQDAHNHPGNGWLVQQEAFIPEK